MAYPDPTPVIRGRRNVKEFLRRLDTFTLTPEQKELYRGALASYRRAAARKVDPEPQMDSGSF